MRRHALGGISNLKKNKTFFNLSKVLCDWQPVLQSVVVLRWRAIRFEGAHTLDLVLGDEDQYNCQIKHGCTIRAHAHAHNEILIIDAECRCKSFWQIFAQRSCIKMQELVHKGLTLIRV